MLFFQGFFRTDCGIVSSRVQFNLDDLLWVLTDSQLKAAIVFANSLKEIVKRSAAQSKLLAHEKLKVFRFNHNRDSGLPGLISDFRHKGFFDDGNLRIYQSCRNKVRPHQVEVYKHREQHRNKTRK